MKAARFHYTEARQLIRLKGDEIPPGAGKAGFSTISGEISLFYDVPMDDLEHDAVYRQCYEILAQEKD